MVFLVEASLCSHIAEKRRENAEQFFPFFASEENLFCCLSSFLFYTELSATLHVFQERGKDKKNHLLLLPLPTKGEEGRLTTQLNSRLTNGGEEEEKVKK